MKNLIRSIARTPGVLFMSILTLGFLLNAGVQYIDNTGFEGPNLMAAATLFLGQLVVAMVHQTRRLCEHRSRASAQ